MLFALSALAYSDLSLNYTPSAAVVRCFARLMYWRKVSDLSLSIYLSLSLSLPLYLSIYLSISLSIYIYIYTHR